MRTPFCGIACRTSLPHVSSKAKSVSSEPELLNMKMHSPKFMHVAYIMFDKLPHSPPERDEMYPKMGFKMRYILVPQFQGVWGTRFWVLGGAKGRPWGAFGRPMRVPWEPQGGPRGNPRGPEGHPRSPKRAPKGAQGNPEGAHRSLQDTKGPKRRGSQESPPSGPSWAQGACPQHLLINISACLRISRSNYFCSIREFRY